MKICEFITFVIIVNLLYVSVFFADHLQGDVFTKDMSQRQTNPMYKRRILSFEWVIHIIYVGKYDAQKDLHSRTGRDEKKGITQEKMERGSRKRSSSAGSEKMERVGGR